MTALLKNWHPMRILRGIFAGWIFWEAARSGEWFLALPGSIFAIQAIFDLGCGAAGCAIPTRNARETEEVNYEEVR